MSSNDQWPPVASPAKGVAKVNGNKRNVKESQQQILSVVNEMFGSALEPDVILQVVQNCNWDLQPSIEGLITLTETVDNPLTWNNISENEKIEVPLENRSACVSDNTPKEPSIIRSQENSISLSEADTASTLPPKFEKPKRGGAKNRMDSFCGNIAKLKSSGESSARNQETSIPKDTPTLTDDVCFFDDIRHYGAAGTKIYRENSPKIPNFGNLPDVPEIALKMSPQTWVQRGRKNARGSPPTETKKRETFLDTKTAAENKEFNKPEQKVASLESKTNMRKTESESLCGLKVQYRLTGMESSSDDDADVVIEDESSDYKINPATSMSISVCQFLSPSTQTAPQRTQPEIHMINTPSPPRTPQRSLHDATLNRIKIAISRGYKIMILLRGLPGSGKSTLARSIIATTIGGNSAHYIFSTDDFFVTLGRGVYQFDPTRIQDAHSTNHKKVWTATKEGRSPIIVDNTNIEAWEMRPYAAMAVENGYIVEILEPNTPWAQNVNELAKKNTHNISKAKIRERFQRYERGLTGKKLLDKYSLKYSSKNQPPQMRRVPPIPTVIDPQKAVPTIADFKANWAGNERNDFVLTTQDIESMRNIDESHSSIGLTSECASLADDSSNSSNNHDRVSNYGDKMFDDYLQELQDSDDESFEMLEGTTSLHSSDIGKSLSNKEDSRIDSPSHTPEVTVEDLLTGGTNDPSPTGSQQIFGAIGSERKGSLSVASSIGNIDVEKPDSLEHEKTKNDNVLSQCWDFTLLLGRDKIHSTHDPSEELNDEPKDRKILRSKRRISQLPTDPAAQFADVQDEAETKILQNSKNEEGSEKNKENFIETEPKIIDNIISDEVLITDETLTSNIVENESLEIQPKGKDDTLIEDNKMANEQQEESIKIDSSLLRDALNTENLAHPSEKISECSMEIVEVPEVPSTFGSFFNMIKASILGAGDDGSSVDGKYDILQKLENDSIHDNVPTRFDDCKDNDKDSMKNVDTVDFPGKKNDNESPSCSDLSIDELSVESNVENTFPDLSTNPFRKEMLESQLIDKGVEDSQLETDNINSISWKESPFPVNTNISFPIVTSREIQKEVSLFDASTNTTYYDFNVSYVGGTSEPGYRELMAKSRCINEGNVAIAKIERPPLKLMLDKSSMTSEENILIGEPNLNPEKGKDSGDRIQELIELFPHIPIESLTAFYVQQCKKNFEWAVEVLLEDGSDFTLKGLEIKRPSVENDDENRPSVDNDKKGKIDHDRLKRSHSSSPRHRRNKSKDFRSFSMEFVDGHDWTSGENLHIGETISYTNDDEEEEAMYQQLYEHAISTAGVPLETPEIPETSSEEENDDEIELNFGREFINQLEKTFGNPDFVFPDEFTPAIKIKKSMAEELHALWIQSMYRQLNARHAQLDEMIAKDEAIARALHREETMEPPKEPAVPNFEEIMDMEMALASYKNELKEKIARETPNDLASRLSRQMLYESLPDIDPQTLSEILKAHNGNFKETCETIETSTGRRISKTESLKKQQSLLDRVNEESKNRGIEQNSTNDALPLIVVRPDVISSTGKTDKTSYKSALERGREARREAEKQFSLRIDYFNKAREAYRKGYPDVAAYYSQMAKLHSENIQAAHAEAAEAFLSAQICGNDDDATLDLHNLFVTEALEALDSFLEHHSRKLGKSNKRSTVLYIITGRGARSNNGLSKIKPAVTKKLSTRNIRFAEANPGCLKVTLSKKNGLLE